MVRHRWLPGVIATLALLVGCTPVAEPAPELTAETTPTVAPIPTAEPAPYPESAFDLACDDVLHEMIGLFGVPAAPVSATLLTRNAPTWYPGPAEHLFARAAGIACSYDDGELAWEVVVLPGAEAALLSLDDAGYTARDREPSCGDGHCSIVLRDGDALLESSVRGPGVTGDDLDRVSAVMTALVARASATQTEATLVPSAIVGAECESLLDPAALSDAWQVSAGFGGGFEGWSIAAHAYWERGGGVACNYFDPDIDPIDDDAFLLTLTTLPAGRWASELEDGRSPVDVVGADRAWTGSADYVGYGLAQSFVDIVVGDDWVRLTTAGSRTAQDLLPVAAVVAGSMAELGS